MGLYNSGSFGLSCAQPDPTQVERICLGLARRGLAGLGMIGNGKAGLLCARLGWVGLDWGWLARLGLDELGLVELSSAGLVRAAIGSAVLESGWDWLGWAELS